MPTFMIRSEWLTFFHPVSQPQPQIDISLRIETEETATYVAISQPFNPFHQVLCSSAFKRNEIIEYILDYNVLSLIQSAIFIAVDKN